MHYTGRFHDPRKDKVGQGQTREVPSKMINKEWDSAEKRQRQRPSTDKNGIGVWPTIDVKVNYLDYAVGLINIIFLCIHTHVYLKFSVNNAASATDPELYM